MIAQALHKASGTKSSFTWTEETQESFESLKNEEAFVIHTISRLPGCKRTTFLYTDESLTAIGAVLARVQDGKERACCNASKSFSKS